MSFVKLIEQYGSLVFYIFQLRNTCNYTPTNKVAGVYSDPYVRPFVCSSVRLSPSLILYSSKTAEQNFLKLSGIVLSLHDAILHLLY